MNKKILAISGKKNSGKTTLIEKLIPILEERGIRTAIVKHDGHSFDPDVEGKDTYRFFHAGACGTAIFDSGKYMVVNRESISEGFLLKFFKNADLLILEGFKWTDWPKLEIVRKGITETHVCKEESIIGILSDFNYSLKGIPTYDLNDTDKIADVIENYVFGQSTSENNCFINGMLRYDKFDAPKESEAEIYLNEKNLMNIVCSGTDLKAQITGFLFCEGFIKSVKDINSVLIEEKNEKILVNVDMKDVEIPEYTRKLPGFGNGVDFSNNCNNSCLQNNFSVENRVLCSLYNKASELCSGYNSIGGVHWTALCSSDNIICFAEDISRHNSMDKVIGKYLIENRKESIDIILTSGRISSEMLKKCCKLEIPVICSLSAPTDAAVKTAEEKDMTIVGYLRSDRGKIYSCNRRIK